jgi:hypothetical protein
MPGLECHDVRRDDRSVSGGRLPKDDVVAVPHCVAIIDEEFDCMGGHIRSTRMVQNPQPAFRGCRHRSLFVVIYARRHKQGYD